MTSPELLRVLDVAYRFEGDDERWLTGVAEALRPSLDVGCGIHAFFIDVSLPDAVRIDRPVSVGLADDWAARWRADWWDAFMLTAPSRTLHAMMTHSACNFSVDLWRALSAAIPDFGPHLESHAAPPQTEPAPAAGTMRYPDSLNLVAIDASGQGLVFAANRPLPAQGPVPRALARTWAQLGTHIAAAHRLRQQQLAPSAAASFAPFAPLDRAEVVLDRDRRVLHAEGEGRSNTAIEAIRQAAVAVSHARPEEPGGRVESGDERAAIEAWDALSAGRWTVLDQFDRDGRRYFVARPNAPAPRPTEPLSEREQQVLGALALGHSNKLIAYELGLHPSTISNHLAAAAKKLGAESRVALVKKSKLMHGAR